MQDFKTQTQERRSLKIQESKFSREASEYCDNLTYFFFSYTTVVRIAPCIDPPVRFAPDPARCYRTTNGGTRNKKRERKKTTSGGATTPTWWKWLMSGVGDRLEFRGQYFREKHGAAIPRHPHAITGARRISPSLHLWSPPPQLAIFSGGSGRDGRGRAGQGRFCQFVTLQCINEQTFIKAEIVFSAIANCRVALALRWSTSSIFCSLFPRGERWWFFPKGRRILESLPTNIEFYTNSRLFQYFITVKKLFLGIQNIYSFHSRFVQIQVRIINYIYIPYCIILYYVLQILHIMPNINNSLVISLCLFLRIIPNL